MSIRKGKEQEIQYDEDGNPFAYWGKAKVMISDFHRELARFVDGDWRYWYGMDCTKDLVIHISRDGDTCVLGKVSA